MINSHSWMCFPLQWISLIAFWTHVNFGICNILWQLVPEFNYALCEKVLFFACFLSHLPVSFGSPQFLHCEKYSVIFLCSFFCATHDFIGVYATCTPSFFYLTWKVIISVVASLHGHCFIASVSLATLSPVLVLRNSLKEQNCTQYSKCICILES